MRSIFSPRLVNGPFGDPGLYVDLRFERQALLFDLGDISVLMPRLLLRLSHVFVTHTHMDHFVGFDRLLRVVLGRKDRVVLHGGPGFIDQIEHRLAAYTWNVVHRYEPALVIEAHELTPDGGARRAIFSSRAGFEREADTAQTATGDLIHDDRTFRVRGTFVDHGVPVLAYALEEKAHVNIWKNRLAELGLSTGPWLRALKDAVLADLPDTTPITAVRHDAHGAHHEACSLGELRRALEIVPGRRIGYVTDLEYTPDNVARLEALLQGCDLLYIESVFLAEHADHAARKHHLTADQAGAIAQRLRAGAVTPFHFSPRYTDRPQAVYAAVARRASLAAE